MQNLNVLFVKLMCTIHIDLRSIEDPYQLNIGVF